jgi:transcriptional regulator with XRE-family HTH domain
MAELADLLTNLTARHALAHRDITTVFRILRDAGVSQARIASATGQGQSEVSEIMSGRQVQSVALLERIADGLGVPRGWMGLAYAPDLEAGSPAAEDTPTEDETNANLLRHAANVLCGSPVLGPADPIRVKDIPTPVPRRIGAADVAQVAATTERLGYLNGEFGGIPIIAHTQASEALLGAGMRDTVRQHLLLALADAHRGTGAAATSAGLRDLARQHYTRGMDCAGAAGDPLRAVVSLDRLGQLEVDVEPNEALKLFQLGVAAAPSPLPRSLVEYHCVWALGLLGLASEAIAALLGPATLTRRPATNPDRGSTLPRQCRISRGAPISPSAASTGPRWPLLQQWTG